MASVSLEGAVIIVPQERCETLRAQGKKNPLIRYILLWWEGGERMCRGEGGEGPFLEHEVSGSRELGVRALRYAALKKGMVG